MIRCISPYRSSYGQYTPGETITDAVLEAVLLVDSPGSFEVVAERALNAPPAHRMMTGADSETRATVEVKRASVSVDVSPGHTGTAHTADSKPPRAHKGRPSVAPNRNPPPRMPKAE